MTDRGFHDLHQLSLFEVLSFCPLDKFCISYVYLMGVFVSISLDAQDIGYATLILCFIISDCWT